MAKPVRADRSTVTAPAVSDAGAVSAPFVKASEVVAVPSVTSQPAAVRVKVSVSWLAAPSAS